MITRLKAFLQIPMGRSLVIWERLMKQMSIAFHLPTVDMDRQVEEFVALPMEPTTSPVIHTCDPHVERPCSTSPSVSSHYR